MATTARRYIEIEVDAAQALRTLRGIEDASKGTEKALTGLQRQFQAMGDAFRGFLGFLGAQELIGFADAAANIEQRLQAVTGTVAEGQDVFNELLTIANRLGVGVQELADSFAKLQVALPEQGTREVIAALEAVSTVLATTGASTQQVNAVLLQFNQALASGVLQGDELRSVYENAPVLLKAWQEAADFTTQSIKELSASGAFTTESFFELLPQIRETAVTLIGMEEPATTIARAFEVLKNSVIELFKESGSVSVVMSTLANAIILVAENLDLLVTAAGVFIALKIPGYLKSIAVSAGLLVGNVDKITTAQAAVSAGASIWVEMVEWFTGARQGVAGLVGPLDRLRSALDSTVGRFIALFAVFETWEWAIDRINEAAGAMDRLVERAKTAAEDTAAFVEEIAKVREFDVDTTSIFELREGLRFANRSARDFAAEIERLEEELEGLVNFAGQIPASTRFFAPEEAERAEFLIQQIANLRRQLLAAEIASEDLAQGLARVTAEADSGTRQSFDDLMRDLDALAEVGGRVATQRVRVQAQFELAGLEGLDQVRATIAQSFETPIRKAEVAIEEANARLVELKEGLRFAETRDEIEKFNKEIEKQNEVLKDNEAAIRAIRQVRQEQEEPLVQQAEALREAEAIGKALRLIDREFQDSVDTQFALQELFDERRISADELAKALAGLGEATAAPGLEAAQRQQKELARNLEAAERAADTAAKRLDVYAESGEKGVEVFDALARVQEAFDGALRDQKTTLENATDSQIEYAQAVADVQRRLETTEFAARIAQQARESAIALRESQNAAEDAEDALRAFNRQGETGLAVFQRQQRLQEAFTEALQQQGVTFRTANQEQLQFARNITQALRDQLDAQDRLNRAQRQSAAILEAQARIENIGIGVTAEIQDFGDISNLVDDITSQAVRGNREAAQSLFDIAEENLRRLAQDVDGAFAERALERAKDELQRAAKIAFREPEPPPGASVLDAEIAAAAELTVPTLVAPVAVDEESLDAAIVDMQNRFSRETFTVQVVPELVGLAVDDVVSETVNQEGAAPA